MKKIIAIVLICICVLGSVGCNQQPQQVQDTQQLQQVQDTQQPQQVQDTQQPQQVQDTQQSQQVQGSQLLAEGNVINIDVSSYPLGYNYSFSEADAKAIVDYLSALNLESNFEENPNEYVGSTWHIFLKYENGDTLTIYHFGNKFIMGKDRSWYKMTYEEASRFDTLLDELTKNSNMSSRGEETLFSTKSFKNQSC